MKPSELLNVKFVDQSKLKKKHEMSYSSLLNSQSQEIITSQSQILPVIKNHSNLKNSNRLNSSKSKSPINENDISIRSRLHTEIIPDYGKRDKCLSPSKQTQSHSKIRSIVNNLFGSYEQDYVT